MRDRTIASLAGMEQTKAGAAILRGAYWKMRAANERDEPAPRPSDQPRPRDFPVMHLGSPR